MFGGGLANSNGAISSTTNQFIPAPASQNTNDSNADPFFIDITGRVLRGKNPAVYLISCTATTRSEDQPRQPLCPEMLRWDAMQEERLSQGVASGAAGISLKPVPLSVLLDPKHPPEGVFSKFVFDGDTVHSSLVSAQHSLLLPPATKTTGAPHTVLPFCSEMEHWDDICDEALQNQNSNPSSEGSKRNPIVQSSAVIAAAAKERMKDIFVSVSLFSVDLWKVSSKSLESHSFYTGTRAMKHLRGDDTGCHRFCTEMLHFDEVMGEKRKREGLPSMESLFGIPNVKA